ncbi:uncharacterized protein LOC142224431 [Haematobia irritans]|uniref:uncharacterized protein LOC142224431 n=1 Tax=Haematobia irritans TaxID=7368 RepID=UPI003F4FF6AF
MFSKLGNLVKMGLKTRPKHAFPQIQLHYRKITSNSSKVEILDINMDSEEMLETTNCVATIKATMDTLSPPIETTDINGSLISPVDIDPWLDEESVKEGTVDMEMIEDHKKVIEYNDQPKNRSGLYVFKDIEIWLPPSILTKSTYRYDVDGLNGNDPNNSAIIPDDTRICKYETLELK